MKYCKKERLSIIKCDDEEIVTFEEIIQTLKERPNNIIYCEKEGRLIGIITMGDIKRACEKQQEFVSINKKYTYLSSTNIIRAKNIFDERLTINDIPVVSEDKRLQGSYSRLEDNTSERAMQLLLKYSKNELQKLLGKRVALFNQCSIGTEKEIIICCEELRRAGNDVDIVDINEIENAFSKYDLILFKNENELCGIRTLYKYVLDKQIPLGKIKIIKSLYEINEREFATNNIKKLKENGIEVFTMQVAMTNSEYWEKYNEEKNSYYNKINKKRTYEIFPELRRDFFADLYSEEQVETISEIPYCVERDGYEVRLSDHKSQYYNVKEGERYTPGQPKKYEKTIYMFGPCFVVGYGVEDKNTIASFLQKKINEEKIPARVVNNGVWCGDLFTLERIAKSGLKRGDIVLLFYNNEAFDGIGNINLADSLEREKVAYSNLLDFPTHANHRVFSLWANELYEKIEVSLKKHVNDNGPVKLESVIRQYEKQYVEKYFEKKDFRNKIVGSIVMNCNPFTNGHKHLIKYAASKVDELVIFVVQEDKSIFSFYERFSMVVEGTNGIGNVIIVPSGRLILSADTMPEYFNKQADDEIMKNAEFDVLLFANGIAKKLNVSKRFVGEEKDDYVTNIYNCAMKNNLPKNGIELIEIPRKKENERTISASYVRENLTVDKFEIILSIVPFSTINMLEESLINE